MLKTFLRQFENEFDIRLHESANELNKEKEELRNEVAGKNYPPDGVINRYISLHAKRFENLCNLSCTLLRKNLDDNKLYKIRRQTTKDKITNIVVNRYNGTIRTINESEIPQLIAAWGKIWPPALQIAATTSTSRLTTITNQTQRKLEIVINEYNHNPKHVLASKKADIIISIITTIITFIVTYCISKFFNLI